MGFAVLGAGLSVLVRDPDFVGQAELESVATGEVFQVSRDGHRRRLRLLGKTQFLRAENIVVKCSIHASEYIILGLHITICVSIFCATPNRFGNVFDLSVVVVSMSCFAMGLVAGIRMRLRRLWPWHLGHRDRHAGSVFQGIDLLCGGLSRLHVTQFSDCDSNYIAVQCMAHLSVENSVCIC